MQKHILKIKHEFWNKILDDTKKCEIRLNDRDYQKGDTIVFKTLWESDIRPAEVRFEENYLIHDEREFLITHVLHFPEGLKEGYVALSIQPIN